MPDPRRTPEIVAAAFTLPQATSRIEALGHGLINETYLLHAADGTPVAVLQRINPRVFTEPQRQMANLRAVTDHVQAHGRNTLRLPRLYPTRDGDDFLIDTDGACWRALEYIAETRVLNAAQTPAQAAAVGRALGQFHAMVQALDCSALADTLRHFHVTPVYLQRFDEAYAAASANAAGDVSDLVAFIEQRRAGADVLEDAKRTGRLPRRPVHGDPKIDNFLFDRSADRVVALVDLDTINCGLTQYDIGDCLRSVCNPAGESPATLEAARFELSFCGAALEAYLAEAGHFFTPADYDFLYLAVALIPFELGLRFLTDHLTGDQYFKTAFRGQNLHRARVQFRLAAEIEHNRAPIESLIDRARTR